MRRLVCGLLNFALVSASAFAAGDQGARVAPPIPSAAAASNKVTGMRIQISVNGKVLATATLDNNATARDFAARLPLNVNLKDYAATEKIADLPGALSTQGAPDAYTPAAGDISYYAPWGNLAIFYKDGHHSKGLVRLGRLDSGVDALQRLGAGPARVERARP
jgi:hypothetical protein